jgi:5-oxoprolinase (ATP-hydrolysing) subunit C
MTRPVITVVAVGGPAMIQDGGRPGRMHEGIPPGGAMAPELLAAANLALGNPAGAAAIEHFGPLTVVASATVVAATDERLLELSAAPVTLVPRGRVGYLAAGGGLDVPVVLGGRGTLPVARVGGLEGRLLRKGDALAMGSGDVEARPPIPPRWGDAEVAVRLGPDPSDTRALSGGPFTISSIGDRVGVRLAGPRVHAPALLASAPMVRGAIQATPAGELVVLGPDHPTTGGYPVVAVVVEADVGRLLAMRPGAKVTFRALD